MTKNTENIEFDTLTHPLLILIFVSLLFDTNLRCASFWKNKHSPQLILAIFPTIVSISKSTLDKPNVNEVVSSIPSFVYVCF